MQFGGIKYVFKLWINGSESSIADVWLGSKYAFVNITLHFLKERIFRKLMKFLKVLCKKNKIQKQPPEVFFKKRCS